MGDNGNGELGDGTTTNRTSPVQILSGGVQAVAGGYSHSLILKTDGSLWAMGDNSYGDLGDGTTTQRNAPVEILSGGVQAVSAGYFFSLILKTDGSLWAMGDNDHGQLGDGTTTNRTSPVQILSGGVQTVAAGGYQSLILKADGSLWAVGGNQYGQLGDGTTTNRTSPVQILSSGVQAVAGGFFDSLFLKTDGSLWSTGGNYEGQLGDGTTNSRNAPELIAVNVQKISAGDSHSMVVASGNIGLVPTFTAQPASQTVNAGQNASFTASISGIPTPTVKWQVSTDNGSTWNDVTSSSPYSGQATGTLAITGATAAMNGFEYQCLASNSAQSNVASSAVTLTVDTVPTLTTQPTAQSVTAGGNSTFTVAASGNPSPTYQWQVSTDSGKTWTTLTDVAPYNGTKTGTLTITGATATINGYQYQCLASNSVQSNVASNAVTLTVDTVPAITTQPTSQTVTAGGNAVFTVVASGNPAPTYQWQVNTNGGSTWTNLTNTVPYSGTATATLTITGATAVMNGYQYQCLASNSAQSGVASTAAVLSVIPSAATADAGQSVISSGFMATWNAMSGAMGYRLDVSTNSSFSSFVSGYQNLDVSNVTSMAISGLNANATYYYRVRAYNSAGTGAYSSTVTVTTTPTINITAPLTVSTLAGTALTYGSIDGTGAAARFHYPSGVAADSAGNVYVADTDNDIIRKIVASTGAVTTLAGQAGISGNIDASGSAARFNNPSGVAVDSAGNVYVTDTLNNTLRKVTASGAVSTLAGQAGASGSANGIGTAALFQGPQGLALDNAGDLYIADTNNHTIRKMVLSTGAVTTFAGLAGNAGNSDGTSSARFDFPSDVTVDASGNVYVADTENSTIRKVTPAGVVTTIAGNPEQSGGADGIGTAATFDNPAAITIDTLGNLYVANTDNHTIRMIVPATQTVTTIAGIAGTSGSTNGSGSTALFFAPTGIGADANGNLYIADTNNDTIRLGLLAMAPAIQTQPQSQTVTAGSSVQFSVTASGRPAVTYQWYFGGAAISGTTSSSYSLSNAQAANAGSYAVTVANTMGSVTSNAATLTVNAATPPPSGGGGESSGGGGGGGAPSAWFCCALLILAVARLIQGRMKIERSATPASV